MHIQQPRPRFICWRATLAEPATHQIAQLQSKVNPCDAKTLRVPHAGACTKMMKSSREHYQCVKTSYLMDILLSVKFSSLIIEP